MSAPAIANRLARQIGWDEIDPRAVGTLIELARREDLEGWGLAAPPQRSGDITSALLPHPAATGTARLVAREDMVVCGLPLVPWILDCYGAGVVFTPDLQDGDRCPRATPLGTVSGPAGVILQAERVLLNFLQRLSGIASSTRDFVDALGDSPTRLLDTRKTTPGYRVLEKYAVACGGGFNHRLGLYDRVMLKDNHLAAAAADSGAALAGLVRTARERWPEMIVELEVDRLDQIQPALEAGVENLLLDNFSDVELRRAVALIGDRAASEASGGITRDRLARIGAIGLDFISTGATVHQATWRDIGLDWIAAPEN
jgi:nicotinate-nucleotide pyrophosphorylase (carboxylating)